jgi:hypothetical protein
MWVILNTYESNNALTEIGRFILFILAQRNSRREIMAGKKTSRSKKREQEALENYEFDTSTYVVLSSSVRRDADSGRLVKVCKDSKKSS